MKLEHLTNTFPTNLHEELANKIVESSQLSIGTAFISQETISLIETALVFAKKKRKKISFRILTGLYGNSNKKSDLETLLKLTEKFPDQLEVNISRSVKFHWKYYHLISGEKETFYIGSANFTTGGTKTNREIVLKISGSKRKKERELISLTKSFDEEWNNSGTLNSFPIQDYEESVQIKLIKKQQPSSIKNFLNQKAVVTYENNLSDKAFAVFLQNDASKSTKKAISSQRPDWNNFDWVVFNRKNLYNSCIKTGKILIFSKQGRKIDCCLVDIKDKSANKIKTVDGEYFVAYEQRKHKVVSPETIQKLKISTLAIDLNGRKKPFVTKTLSKQQVAILKVLLGIS